MNLRQFQQTEAALKPHFLLFGNPVAHSLSPLMHNKAAEFYGMNVRYHAINLAVNELDIVASHLNREEFRGANITIPYKQTLLNYPDTLGDTARAFGAINTIVKEQGILTGYNTDAHGFSVPLKPYADELAGQRAVVFGSGGASKAIVHALSLFDMEEIVLISRNPRNISGYETNGQVRADSYEAWPAWAEEAVLIVNATPLGMEPKVSGSPVHEGEIRFLAEKICYDIVYKPLETRFLKQAKEAGARTIGGLEMLIHQGSRSFELWTGKPFPLDEVRGLLHEHIRS